MTQSQLSTLLLRGATARDAAGVQALLPGLRVPVGAQLLVLADPSDSEERSVRAAAVVAPAPWCVLATGVDRRWPPVAATLVEQLCGWALSAGADALRFTVGCDEEVLAAVVADSRTRLTGGGAALIEL